MEEIVTLSKGNNMLKDYKDYNNVLKSTNKAIITYKRSTLESGEECFGEFSWPPKSYTCSFCKREFRSAQALGGHMNVHRREKAKLRQINPQRYLSFLNHKSQFLDQNPNLSPNVITCLSSNVSSFPTMPQVPFTYSCCVPFSDPCGCSHVLSLSNSTKGETRSRKTDLMVDCFGHEKEGVIVRKSAIDMVVEHKLDDLDLELRLGCS